MSAVSNGVTTPRLSHRQKRRARDWWPATSRRAVGIGLPFLDLNAKEGYVLLTQDIPVQAV